MRPGGDGRPGGPATDDRAGPGAGRTCDRATGDPTDLRSGPVAQAQGAGIAAPSPAA